MTAAFYEDSFGYAIPAAYEHDRAVDLACPHCNAPAGEWCEKGNEIKKIPCAARLHIAYVTNNPEGKRQHEDRADHLEAHRRIYTPKWTN